MKRGTSQAARVHVGALTPRHLASPEEGVAIFNALFRRFPDLRPDVYANCEPIRTPFDANVGLDKACWKATLFWRKKGVGPRVEGSVWLGTRDTHTGVFIEARGLPDAQEVAVQALDCLATLLPLDFGYVHATPRAAYAAEASPSADQQRNQMFLVGIMTSVLKKGLPELPWLTLFGRPYLDLFGEDTVRSAPAFAVRKLGQHVTLQLSERLEGFVAASDPVRTVARDVMTHLGHRAFATSDPSEAVTVPRFAYVP
jgi:hypothetical protein